MNTLTAPFTTVANENEVSCLLTLPGVLAALARNDVANFPALRPHQRHAWHSFLVLLAAIALHRAELREPPKTEAEWRPLLRRLTPDHPHDEPWSLIVADLSQPALLQPPIPSGNMADLKNRVATPDALDMLVTARNHDLKQQVMAEAAAEDWLFALVTLQTMQGYSGKTLYGISRMNTGNGNRAAIGISPYGGPAAHWQRDLRRLLALRGAAKSGIYAPNAGLALIWVDPWDGTTSLRQEQLDEFYIEISRRVRLVSEHHGLVAFTVGSNVPRVVSILGGLTGDPWSPIVKKKDGTTTCLTVNESGLGYRSMVKFMFSDNVAPAPLQALAEDDETKGLHILARALVRGEGKTEGYHERRVKLSRSFKSSGRERASEPAAHAAGERVELAGLMQNKVLKRALLSLFQNGPEKIKADDKESLRKAEPFLKRFDLEVDRSFFPDLWAEMEEDEPEMREQIRGEWVRKLKRVCEHLLHAAEGEAARSSRRRYRAVVHAQDRLSGAARFDENLKPYFVESSTA